MKEWDAQEGGRDREGSKESDISIEGDLKWASEKYGAREIPRIPTRMTAVKTLSNSGEDA